MQVSMCARKRLRNIKIKIVGEPRGAGKLKTYVRYRFGPRVAAQNPNAKPLSRLESKSLPHDPGENILCLCG